MSLIMMFINQNTLELCKKISKNNVSDDGILSYICLYLFLICISSNLISQLGDAGHVV